MMTVYTALLVLGTNTDPAQLARALAALAATCRVVRRSSLYRSPDARGGAQPYYNLAAAIGTTLEPAALKRDVLRPLEMRLGRDRTTPDRVALDIDIILWDDAILTYGDKPSPIPHPDLLRHAHVAVPLAEIAPDTVHPETGEMLAQIAARIDTTNLVLVESPAP